MYEFTQSNIMNEIVHIFDAWDNFSLRCLITKSSQSAK